MSKSIPAFKDDNVAPKSLICSKAGECSGCDLIALNTAGLTLQRASALARLGLDDVHVQTRWIQIGGLRDRLEFTLDAKPTTTSQVRFGLFGVQAKEIVDIDICPQLSSGLQEWLTDFRKDFPPLRSRGSIRLRVSPGRQRGAWLDFANEDILFLLDEAEWLGRQLQAGVIVEMGQKRKRVVLADQGPRKHRLCDAVLAPWFQTWIRSENAAALEPISLYGTIGTFTQPGFQANQALIETVLQHAELDLSKPQRNLRVAEFGAGIGNFTLPLLSAGASVHVFESDRTALEALEVAVQAAKLDRDKLTVHAGDFILSPKAAVRAKAAINGFDLVVVDPPRPGLGDFIPSLSEQTRGARWVYVSCYPESFAKDRIELRRHGLELERMTIVEQFPFTRHFEIVGSFVPK